MDRDYDKLMNLKRLIEGSPGVYTLYKDLDSRKDPKSKNILVICRTVKDAKEALKMSARNFIEKAEFNLIKLWLKIDDTTIYFLPMSRIEFVVGMKYKEYYFDETWGKSLWK